MRALPALIENQSFEFDAIVIGGGVNGTAIARDAALRGLKVLLLEKEDFSSGASAWNSRMVHGGLRYLEYGEIDLVRDSLLEREWLLRVASHLVKPLPFVFPFYKRNRRPAWLVTAGMITYDVLSMDKSLDRFHLVSRERLLQQAPGLDPQELRGGASYLECQADYVERLSVENAVSAAQYGAVILTHARVEEFIVEKGVVRGVVFRDTLADRAYRAHARLTVNVAGPWVDDVLKSLGPSVPRLTGGTKGSHLVISPFPGAPSHSMYYEAQSDGRPVLVIPWLGKFLIGSTDIRYSGDLDCVAADDAEIDYILRETNLLFPSANLTRDSVLFSYSGVRPLPYQEKGSEGSITRRHIVKDHAPELEGLMSVIGGKLTSFRSLAQDVVNKMLKKLGGKPRRCITAYIPLPGASVRDYPAFCAWFRANAGLPEETANRLLNIYGTRSTEVLEFAKMSPDLLKPFSPETGAIGAEVLMAFRRDMAETISDVLLRRTMVALGPGLGVGADEAAARIAQRYLGMDAQLAEREVMMYRQYIERFQPPRS